MEGQTSIPPLAWQCKHYTGRGIMKLHESGTALAEGMGVLVLKMTDSSGFFEKGHRSRRRARPRVSER